MVLAQCTLTEAGTVYPSHQTLRIFLVLAILQLKRGFTLTVLLMVRGSQQMLLAAFTGNTLALLLVLAVLVAVRIYLNHGFH